MIRRLDRRRLSREHDYKLHGTNSCVRLQNSPAWKFRGILKTLITKLRSHDPKVRFETFGKMFFAPEKRDERLCEVNINPKCPDWTY